MGVLSEVQLIGKALQEAGKIELYTKLLEIQEKTLEVQEENKMLKAEIEELKRVASISGSIQFKDNAYYLPENDGPYCSCCWDQDHKLIRLHKTVYRYFLCPSCKNNTDKDKVWHK